MVAEIYYDYSAILDAPPVNVYPGLQVLVSATPTALSDFDGHANECATYGLASNWGFQVAEAGAIIRSEPFRTQFIADGLGGVPTPDPGSPPIGGVTLTAQPAVIVPAGSSGTLYSGSLENLSALQEFGAIEFDRSTQPDMVSSGANAGWSNPSRAFNSSWSNFATNGSATGDPLTGTMPSNATMRGVIINLRAGQDDIGYELLLEILSSDLTTVLHSQALKTQIDHAYMEIPLPTGGVAFARAIRITGTELLSTNDLAVKQVIPTTTENTRVWSANPDCAKVHESGGDVLVYNHGVYQREFRAITIS